MLPSIQASPGHRVHALTCAQVEHTGRSRVRIARTSLSCGECFQKRLSGHIWLIIDSSHSKFVRPLLRAM